MPHNSGPITAPSGCTDCDIYPCDHTGCDCGDGPFHNPGPGCPGQPPYRLHERCPDCSAQRRGTAISGGIETAEYACGRIDRIDTEHGMGEIRKACVGAHPVELSGAAVIDGGTWFASATMDAPMVRDYRDIVKVYGNRRDWFMDPATARSMASALQHFADRAEAFRVE